MFLVLGISFTVHATDYYVSTNGNDANPGTFASPFLTIGKLLNTIQPGDTGFIRGGTYTLGQTTQRSGTAAQPITIKAYNNEVVVLEGTGNTNSGGRFRIHHDWYVIEGLELRNGDAGFALTSNASHNLLTNCSVDSCYYTGFYLSSIFYLVRGIGALPTFIPSAKCSSASCRALRAYCCPPHCAAGSCQPCVAGAAHTNPGTCAHPCGGRQ